MYLPFGAGAMARCDIRARHVVACEVLTRQSSGYMHLTLTSVHILRAAKRPSADRSRFSLTARLLCVSIMIRGWIETIFVRETLS
jgi:hypothetical protein